MPLTIQNPFSFKKQAVATIHCLIGTEDRNIFHAFNDSTGVHILNHKLQTGYDSVPDAIAPYVVTKGDERIFEGPHCILFEPMSRPWDFAKGDWADTEPKREKGDNVKSKRDVIASTSLHEGLALAAKQGEQKDRFSRVANILFLALGLLIVIAFIIGVSSGIIPKPHL
jgi:hypothetical protein